jgi:tetratricopeptide (TPR) repeat protein
MQHYFTVILYALVTVFGLTWSKLPATQSWYTAPEPLHNSLLQVVKHMQTMHYAKGVSLLDSLQIAHPSRPEPLYFKALALFTEYDDIGGIAKIAQGLQLLHTCETQLDSFTLTPHEQYFWKGLIAIQVGYGYNLQHKSLESALQMRKGAKLLQKVMHIGEAQALVATYDFYVEQITQGLSWLPFIDDNRTAHIQAVETATHNSPYLSLVFRTSAIWMHYDQKQYAKALALTNGFVQQQPTHRIYKQIQADMLFRLGKTQQAKILYLQSEQEYKNSTKDVRYYSAVANLIRIYQDLNEPEKMKQWQMQLTTPEYQKIKPNMPANLLKDLQSRGLL